MRPNRRLRPSVNFAEDPPAALAGPLRELGQEIAEAVRFGKQWMGAFPVSTAGGCPKFQGQPGRASRDSSTCPPLSFLPDTTQQRVGMSGNTKEALNVIIPYHEVAHQWVG